MRLTLISILLSLSFLGHTQIDYSKHSIDGQTAFLGVYFVKITPFFANRFDLPEDYGALVKKVIICTAAERTQLQPLDYIVSVDGQSFTEYYHLKEIMKLKYKPKDVVKVKFYRNGRPQIENIQLGSILDICDQPEEVPCIGASFLPPEASPDALITTNVEPLSAAATMGLVKGDKITSLNGLPVYTTTELDFVLSGLEVGAELTATVIRRNERLTLKGSVQRCGMPNSPPIKELSNSNCGSFTIDLAQSMNALKRAIPYSIINSDKSPEKVSKMFEAAGEYVVVALPYAYTRDALSLTTEFKFENETKRTYYPVASLEASDGSELSVNIYYNGYKGSRSTGAQLVIRYIDRDRRLLIRSEANIAAGISSSVQVATRNDSLVVCIDGIRDTSLALTPSQLSPKAWHLMIGKLNEAPMTFKGEIRSVSVSACSELCTEPVDPETEKDSLIDAADKPKELAEEYKVRKVVEKYDLVTSDSTLLLEVWDHQQEDGDTIILALNDIVLLDTYLLGNKKTKLQIPLNEGRNELKLVAVNLGSIPPNTAAFRLEDSNKRHPSVILRSDLGTTEAIVIFRKGSDIEVQKED